MLPCGPTLTLLAVVLVICGDIAESQVNTCARLATYNAGLLGLVPEKESRTPLVTSGLMINDADVYCLQEVWLESDLEVMLQQMKTAYPYHYSPLHSSPNTLRRGQHRFLEVILSWSRTDSACTIRERVYWEDVLTPCVVAQGCLQAAQLGNGPLTQCIADRCTEELLSPRLSAECIQCRLAFSPLGAGDAAEECQFNRELRRNRYNSFGLALISKKPILSAKTVSFHEEDDLVLARAYIEAEIEDIGKVVCLHMTSIFPIYLEYNKIYPDYLTQHAAEAQTLIGTYASQDAILIGDFNTGPAVLDNGVNEEYGQNYDLFVDAGYKSHFIDNVGTCTFCESNQLTGGGFNVLVDNVLTRGDAYNVTYSRRILDETFLGLYPSDHFGVEVEVCPKIEEQPSIPTKK